jgi:hypothetical protein
VHFRRPPVSSTKRFVADAPLERLETGTRTVVEIVGYPDGHVRLVASMVEGPRNARRIVQGPFLMFLDSNEAKDALDAIVDRVDAAARDTSA